jgi:CRP/FNR family transcriptional regulator, dissimilatory nitrate respiration regulator
MDMDILLKNSELFSGLSESAAKKITAMGAQKKISQNNMIFFEGEKGSSFFLLYKGSVRLFKSTQEGREVTVKLVAPGEIFAEVILFEIDHYPVSATAVTNSVLLSINRSSFYTLLDDVAFRNEFISVLMKKQRYLADRIVYLTAYDVEERFFRFLSEHYGRKNSYEFTISKKDMAAAIGTIPETFSRLIQRLTQRGIILWEGNRLELQKEFWNTQDYE